MKLMLFKEYGDITHLPPILPIDQATISMVPYSDICRTNGKLFYEKNEEHLVDSILKQLSPYFTVVDRRPYIERNDRNTGRVIRTCYGDRVILTRV